MPQSPGGEVQVPNSNYRSEALRVECGGRSLGREEGWRTHHLGQMDKAGFGKKRALFTPSSRKGTPPGPKAIPCRAKASLVCAFWGP